MLINVLEKLIGTLEQHLVIIYLHEKPFIQNLLLNVGIYVKISLFTY